VGIKNDPVTQKERKKSVLEQEENRIPALTNITPSFYWATERVKDFGSY